MHRLAKTPHLSGAPAMPEEQTTVAIPRYLDALPGDHAAEPIVRALLERSVGRIRASCASSSTWSASKG